MIEAINVVIGTGIIILNSIPFVLQKPRYLLVTSILSFIIIILFSVMKTAS